MDINDTSSGNVHTMDDPNGVKPIIISAVVVANVIFNSIVIAVISRYSQLREDRTTLFMFSLALSDLANGCVAMPISAALCSSAHSSERQENIILLKIQAVFSVWFTVTSMHNICWVTTCKMIALTNPFRYEQLLTRNRCYAIIVILWVIGALAGAVVAQTVSSWDGIVCIYIAAVSKQNFGLIVVILIVSIICPVVGQIYSTVRIFFVILRTHRQITMQLTPIGGSVPSIPSLTLKTVRSGKNVLIICLALFILTIPYIMHTVLTLMGLRSMFPLWFNFFVIWTFLGNTFVNSLIYIFVFRSVRNKTTQMFRAICGLNPSS